LFQREQFFLKLVGKVNLEFLIFNFFPPPLGGGGGSLTLM